MKDRKTQKTLLNETEENLNTIRNSYVANPYIIFHGQSEIFKSPWDVYMLKTDENLNYYDNYKVHLSLNHKDIDKARPLILDILTKHKVHNFKLVHLGIEKYKDTRNVHGKELTIYLQKESKFPKDTAQENDPEFWIALFNELEDALQKAGIKPNQSFKPQGDKLFSGSQGFIHYRYPDNIINRYIAAKALTACGFTNGEATNLSGDTTFEDWFRELKLHDSKEKQKVNNKPTAPLQIVKQKNIPFQMSNKSENGYEEIKSAYRSAIVDNNAFLIFFGDDKDRVQVVAPHENLALIFKIMFGYEFSRDYLCEFKLNENDINNIKNDTANLNQFFDSSLEQAARYVAILQDVLKEDLKKQGISLSNTIINIVPAVYQHFFMPIMAAWKNNPDKPFFELVDKQALVAAIVKCSFRNREITQINHENPQYVCNLNEESIDDLIQKILKEAEASYQKGLSEENKGNFQAALRHYQRADQLGYIKGKTNTASFYLEGKGGIAKDNKQDINLLQEASEKDMFRLKDINDLTATSTDSNQIDNNSCESRPIIIANDKNSFLAKLTTKLQNTDFTRADILDLFAEMKRNDGSGPYRYIHEQRHSIWDAIRLPLKGKVKKQNEDNFWHTATYQKAVKLLKDAYISRVNDQSANERTDVDAFIDYVRGNSPIHRNETSTRKKMK